jgi:hypothetical protein
MEVVEWLHHNRTEGCTYEAVSDAAKNGYLDIVEFLVQHRKDDCDLKDALEGAEEFNQFEVADFLKREIETSAAPTADTESDSPEPKRRRVSDVSNVT